MLLWMVVGGCTFPLSPCTTNSDCANSFGVGYTCRLSDGICVVPSSGTPSGPSADTGQPMVEFTAVVINEVLYDPSNDMPTDTGAPPPGDANGDRVYVHNEDEFVELINVEAAMTDLSGFALYDEEAWGVGYPRHLIPEGTVLAPGEALVVFGGGTPTGDFGGAQVQVASGGQINMNNANDTLWITNPDGDIVLTFEVEPRSDNPNESYTRNPDIVGLFEQHGDSTTSLFSPGTRVDGTPFR